MTDKTGPSTVDSLYRCVADRHRRQLLTYLRETENGTATVDELVDYVVRQEVNSPAPDRASVAVDIYHLHLPLLADEGVVEFDARTERVQYTSRPDVERRLDGSSRSGTRLEYRKEQG